MTENYPRFLTAKVLESFKESPATLLIGPRQCGKTTLMKELSKTLQLNYVTFDTLNQLVFAHEDPAGFVLGLQKPVIIDEVQRAPEIGLPIKLYIDENRAPGIFGLTGSANPLAAAKLNDSLAGRMYILHLWPLSYGEILNKRSRFLEILFDKESSFLPAPKWGKQEMLDVLLAGGYPLAYTQESSARERWFDNLLTTILERDVKDLSNITKPWELMKLLNILAARPSQLLNLADVGRSASVPYATLNHYMVLLEALFLIVRLPSWHVNRTKRQTKMSKLFFVDTGLLTNQLRLGFEPLKQNGRFLGHVLENFVFLELLKLSGWAVRPFEFYHFHTQSGDEVDFVIENRNGQIVGIEVKASMTITAADVKGLHILAEEAKETFLRGIVLYPGGDIIPLGKHCFAIPITALWEWV